MAAKKHAKKSGSPPKLRAKKGTLAKTRTGKKALARKYLAAFAKSAQKAEMTAEAADVQLHLDTLEKFEKDRLPIEVDLATNEAGIVDSEASLDTALGNYAHKAGTVAKDDPGVLTALAVDSAAARAPRDTSAGGIPTGLTATEGPTSGTMLTKWKRPRGAAAFVVQHLVEIAGLGAAPAVWLPVEGLMTKNVQLLIEDLPPGAQVRVRVRAVGATPGPWSEEVLGRAR